MAPNYVIGSRKNQIIQMHTTKGCILRSDNHYSAHFANQASPSEAILNLWESQNNINDNHTALLRLAKILKDINRLDAVVILERELKK